MVTKEQLETLAELERKLRSTQGKPFDEADRSFLEQDWRDADTIRECLRVLSALANVGSNERIKP